MPFDASDPTPNPTPWLTPALAAYLPERIVPEDWAKPEVCAAKRAASDAAVERIAAEIEALGHSEGAAKLAARFFVAGAGHPHGDIYAFGERSPHGMAAGLAYARWIAAKLGVEADRPVNHMLREAMARAQAVAA